MKITRLLPKPLAIYYQEYFLNRSEAELEYHREMVTVLEEITNEGIQELERLKS